MTNQEIRLECLKIFIECSAPLEFDTHLEQAEKMANFVIGDGVETTTSVKYIVDLQTADSTASENSGEITKTVSEELKGVLNDSEINK